MKKQLLVDIKQLAQKILWSSEAENILKLKKEIHELQEKLAVLAYLERQITENIEVSNAQSLDSKSYREQHWFKDPVPVPEPVIKEEIIEPATEKIKDLVAQMPHEADKVDALLEEVLPPQNFQKNDLEEFASHYQETPVFERKEVVTPPSQTIPEEIDVEKPATNNDIEKPKSLNEMSASGFRIGLNDRIAFTNQLFEGSSDDFQRVISQITTFETFEQAETFIKGKVKPDYNYWLNKDEVATRFMDWVEKQFG